MDRKSKISSSYSNKLHLTKNNNNYYSLLASDGYDDKTVMVSNFSKRRDQDTSWTAEISDNLSLEMTAAQNIWKTKIDLPTRANAWQHTN